MASIVYNKFLYNLLNDALGAMDVRAVLVMSNTDCGTLNDTIATFTNFVTPDVADATGYADVTLASETFTQDNTNDRAEYDAADIVFSGLGGDATRDYRGVCFIDWGTTRNDSVPLFFVQFASDKAKASTSITLTLDTEGLLQLAAA